MKITDSHFHFWNDHMSAYHRVSPERGAELYGQDYTPAVLKPLLDAQGVEQAVLVQVYNDHPGTDEFLSHAFRYAWIAAVVGWVDLASPRIGDILEWYQRVHPKFKGVRHLWQDEADPAFMLRSEMLQGVKELAGRGLTFDLCVKPPNWPFLQPFVDALPEVGLVIDHIAKPRIDEHQFDDWAALMERLAQVPRMTVKLSGLVTEATPHGWKKDDFQPYVDHLLSVFGPDRLMFGSDWPVCLLAADSYAQVFDLVRHLLRHVGEADQAKIMGATCRRFYGID
jgi:L-fuconolactonase